MMIFWAILFVHVATASIIGYKNTHFVSGRTSMVHLFEWKWNDIADECEQFLGPNGYAGVQVSPPSENLIIINPERPWWERHQPVSYKLETRSGSELEFAQMVWRCNRVNVRVYVVAILNHMTGTHELNVGTGGSVVDFDEYEYPGVPYTAENFNYPSCTISTQDYTCCPERVRNCELSGLKDLNQASNSTREIIVAYMNKLIDMGVAGFRIDSAKHIWPEDLSAIYDGLINLNTHHGFGSGWRSAMSAARPFIYQEVMDFGNEAITRDEYTDLGMVTEFRFGYELSRAFRGANALRWLVNWGPAWGLLESEDALVFIDNFDNQRSAASTTSVLTYKEPKPYIGALAFMLAHPYGIPQLMSSYDFQANDQGPPMDDEGNIVSTEAREDGCSNGWVCEHRWPEVVGMVQFRNIAQGTLITNWWDNSNNQIAFCRGNVAFVAFNNDASNLNSNLQTCLPAGVYCDIITGGADDGACLGKSVTVNDNGIGNVYIGTGEDNMVLAIHIGPGSRL